MPGIGMQELIIIFIMGLIIFGPGKLPELGRTLGKAIREFRRVSNDVMDEIDKPIQKKEVSIGVQKADKNETAIKDDAVELELSMEMLKVSVTSFAVTALLLYILPILVSFTVTVIGISTFSPLSFLPLLAD